MDVLIRRLLGGMHTAARLGTNYIKTCRRLKTETLYILWTRINLNRLVDRNKRSQSRHALHAVERKSTTFKGIIIENYESSDDDDDDDDDDYDDDYIAIMTTTVTIQGNEDDIDADYDNHVIDDDDDDDECDYEKNNVAA